MRRRVVVGPAEAHRVMCDPRFLQAQQSQARDSAWRTRGRCLDVDPETFFPVPGDDPTLALSLCRGCPVAGPCLAAALESEELDGVWGATTPDERRVMREVWRAAAQARRTEVRTVG